MSDEDKFGHSHQDSEWLLETGPCILSMSSSTRTLMMLHPDGTIEIPGMITLAPDGRTTLHEGYAPDEAARMFWEAVAIARKAVYGKA